MIVTTAGRTTADMMIRAKQVADDLQCRFEKRKEDSIAHIVKKFQDDVLVVGKNRLELYPETGEDSFFFHPNSASFRMKRLLRGEHDPFIEVTKLEQGMSMLDCTLGLASDSIVASYVTGENGKVTGIEGNKMIAYIVKEGLQQWGSEQKAMNEAMRRISVVHNEHLTYLKQCEDQSFDVVYLDPMFEQTVAQSDGIQGLKHFALYEDIDGETIREALRVAKKRVVLKDHFRSARFETYGFNVQRRKSASFHFGVLEK
ncbi:class I SAM-dependent methyltransferase [Ectobacillus sp. sgz5001026]|uniref:class I SAM-dependent methyltransferase n=1 Tax=Ectobacillus sp. sgz5001026 TaxID=3242473 RepID=UPI0036D412F8